VDKCLCQAHSKSYYCLFRHHILDHSVGRLAINILVFCLFIFDAAPVHANLSLFTFGILYGYSSNCMI
jgi:hypothetical protein